MTVENETLSDITIASADPPQPAAATPGLVGYATRALAEEALSLLSEGNVVMVFADENVGGHRTLYEVAGGALVLRADLTAEILNPGEQMYFSTGVALTEGADDVDRGKQAILLDFDHTMRGRSRDGAKSMHLIGVRDVAGIDGGTHDFGIVGDSRMSWLSVATDLDLIQNNVIDVSNVGNYYASHCDTRLVQFYDAAGADVRTVGVASCDHAGARYDRLVFNNKVAREDARAWFRNVGAVVLQKGGDAGRSWMRWDQGTTQWQAGFRGEPYAWVLECHTGSAQPEHDTGWTRALRADLDGGVALAQDRVAISALGNVTGPGAGSSIRNFNYLTGLHSNNTLHVAGSAALAGDLVLNQRGGVVFMGLEAPARLNVNNGALTFTPGGRLGVGTSTPGYRLQVDGSFAFAPGSAVTPDAPGQVVFELSGDATLTIKARGLRQRRAHGRRGADLR